jgi:hypothetical protein
MQRLLVNLAALMVVVMEALVQLRWPIVSWHKAWCWQSSVMLLLS